MPSDRQEVQQSRRILVVRGQDDPPKCASLFNGGWDCDVVDSLDSAVGQMRDEKYDLVVIEDRQCLPFEDPAIDEAGRDLIRLDGAETGTLDIAGRLERFEEKFVRCAREVLGFETFSIRLLDEKTNRLELVVSRGITEQAKSADVFALADGNGISGYVAATGQCYLCNDVACDTRYAPGMEHAASSLTVPLFLRDKVVGTFSIESDRVDCFGEDQRRSAEMLGRYAAIALHMVDLLMVERRSSAARSLEVAASRVSEPLNDIVGNAAALMKQCAGQDNVVERLRSICGSVGEIRRGLVRRVDEPARLVDRRPIKKARNGILRGKRILVVDDEPIICTMVAEILGGCGADVDVPETPGDGLRIVAKGVYDLVLSDIRMPTTSGYDVFAAAKEADPDVPVVFMTGFGYDPDHSIIRARQDGLSGVLYKPFKVSELVSLLESVLRQAVRGAAAS